MANKEALRELQSRLAERLKLARTQERGKSWLAVEAAGRGLATVMVRELCIRAREEYGLSRLTAVTTVDNGPSRAVLARVGFGAVGSVTLDGGEPATAYELDLGGSFGREWSGTDS